MDIYDRCARGDQSQEKIIKEMAKKKFSED